MATQFPFSFQQNRDSKDTTPSKPTPTSFGQRLAADPKSAPQTSPFASPRKPTQTKTFGTQPAPSEGFGQSIFKPSPDGLLKSPTSAQKPSFGTQGATTRPPLGTQAAKPTFGAQAAKPTFGAQAAKPTFTQTAKPAFGTQAAKPAFGAAQAPRPTFRAASSTAAAPPLQAQSAFHTQNTQRASSPFSKDVKITDDEFLLLRDFIYKQCGIFIAETRKYLVENRLSNRIKELNLKNYSEYYKYLKFDVNREDELNKLFVLMTTNETSFFRNPPQLKVFQEIVLTKMIEKLARQGQKRLRIWSAGCSTGEEPYTLAIIISEVLKNDLAGWDVKITANDLSTQVLEAARTGLYNEYSLRTTPKDIIARYFTKDGQVYKVKNELKRMITFGQINLNNREQLRLVERSNVVFCRNVIIYFDDDMKRRVINSFYDNLLPDGVLLIGHSETLHNICRSFELEHHTGTIVYRKNA